MGIDILFERDKFRIPVKQNLSFRGQNNFVVNVGDKNHYRNYRQIPPRPTVTGDEVLDKKRRHEVTHICALTVNNDFNETNHFDRL